MRLHNMCTQPPDEVAPDEQVYEHLALLRRMDGRLSIESEVLMWVCSQLDHLHCNSNRTEVIRLRIVRRDRTPDGAGKELRDMGGPAQPSVYLEPLQPKTAPQQQVLAACCQLNTAVSAKKPELAA